MIVAYNMNDQFTKDYDWIQLNWSPYLELRDLHLHACRQAHKILDFGTGTGNQAVELAKAGKEVHAIDINPAMQSYIKRKVGHGTLNLHFREMNVGKVDFPDKSFDAVTSMNVIYLVSDPLAAMGEAFRVLKPGGIFSMSGPKADVDLARIKNDCKEELKAKGLYNDEVEKLVQDMAGTTEELLDGATYFTAAKLIEILLSKIGYSEVMESSREAYLGNAYFIAVRR